MSVANYTADAGLTVKQQIVRALKSKLEGMQDGGSDVWRKVYYGDLEELDNQSLPVAGLDFGTEDMLNNTFPCSEYDLPVFIYFRYRGGRGLDEHEVYLYYLGLIQAAVLGDHELGGFAFDVRETSNTPSIVGIDDVYPGGVLHLNVLYKTRLHNPYKTPAQA